MSEGEVQTPRRGVDGIAREAVPARRAGSSLGAEWLGRLRAASGYKMAVRVLGGSWFALLALAAGLKTFILSQGAGIAGFTPTGWPALLSAFCLLMFNLGMFWLILNRPEPAARTAGILPSLTAFAGTYMPWAIPLCATGTASAGLQAVSAALLLTGGVLMVVVICYLGRCFSIVPQARRLVRTGPYAVVRNPLYLAEEIALLGLLLQFFSPLTLGVFLLQGALQIRRIFYEEDLLRRTCPDYADYAGSTARLVPYLW